MNNILFNYLDVFYIVYLDDILIYLEDPLEYETYIKKVLKQLYSVSLQANIKKSEFSVTRTKYLRFIVTIDNIEVDLQKVKVIKNQ